MTLDKKMIQAFLGLVTLFESLSDLEDQILFVDIAIPTLYYLILPHQCGPIPIDGILLFGMYHYEKRTSARLEDIKHKILRAIEEPHPNFQFDVTQCLETMTPLRLDRWSSLIQWCCLYGQYQKETKLQTLKRIQSVIQAYHDQCAEATIQKIHEYVDFTYQVKNF